ncbi:hypothetical protein [Microbacterium album]|uniref:Uncharacterized protein n=1 Tax=Microbacterium album TaxID=2053191 RepID=A0A917IEW8_9MICO|nr:hypothetical protein [Microbacterium album]GGH39657.1 hypothetical protein GCM10010921_11030 [Microbacterium album]
MSDIRLTADRDRDHRPSESAAVRTSHPPQPPSPPRDALMHVSLQDRAPRTALHHRIAMRIGLALLLWGTRPRHVAADRDERDARAERALDQYRREAELARSVREAAASLQQYGR